VFKMNASVLTAHKARLQGMQKALPQAHRQASSIAAHHVLREVTGAATEAGWEPEGSIGLSWRQGQAHITVARSEAGNRVFDNEFGRSDKAPNPVLRTTIRKAHDSANALYGHHLLRGIGAK
jgi:hypothetical protein